jgi:hypothetical protein
VALDKLNHNYDDALKVPSLIVDKSITVAGQLVTGSPVNITDGKAGGNIYVGDATPKAPTIGDIWIDSTSGSGIQLLRWKRVITTSTTSLFGTDDNLVSLAYTPGNEQVYVNGIMLVRGLDYTGTTGQLITLNLALSAGDVVEILGNPTFSVTSVYTQSQSDARYMSSTLYTTKGDLVVGGGNGIYNRLGVGTDGYVLNSDSTAANGVSWQPNGVNVAGKNKIINGDFGIWQRGTSFSVTSATETFSADRWKYNSDGSGGTITLTQQAFSPGAAPVSGYESTYFWRYTCTAARSGTTYAVLFTNLEDVRTFAGQTVTLSFWAKASYSVSIGTPYIQQQFGSGGSSNTAAVPTTNAPLLTTSWQRFSYTMVMPSILGKTIGTSSYIRPVIDLNGVITNATGLNIDIWGVQLESGSVATPFVSNGGGSQQAELAACMRYYQRQFGNGRMGVGFSLSTSGGKFVIPLNVAMRVPPTSMEYGGTLVWYDGVTGASVGTLVAENPTTISCGLSFSGSSGLTQYRPLGLSGNSGDAYLAFNAEI